jgi:hypothetical protein
MPNQLLQSLQNLLNNKSKNLNLISEEFQKIEVSEEQSKGFDKIFIITSIIFSVILGILTYANFQKNNDLRFKYETFKSNLETVESSKITIENLENKIEDLKKYSKLNSEKRKISNFFVFIANITNFLEKEQIVQINYNINNKTINYQLYINSSRKNLDQDLNSFFSKNYKNNQIELVKQTLLSDKTLIQYEFKGNYELR